MKPLLLQRAALCHFLFGPFSSSNSWKICAYFQEQYPKKRECAYF